MSILLPATQSHPRPTPLPPSGNGGAGSGARSNAKLGTVTITEPLEGPTVESVKKWVDVQIPYENIATDQRAGEIAVNFVKQKKTRFQQRMAVNRERWDLITHILNGFTMSRALYGETPTHTGELYKLLEVMVPRIVEAIFGQRPTFRVLGREDVDKIQTELIRALIEYQDYRNHIDDRAEEWVRTMLVYSICPLKVTWQQQFEKHVKREVPRKVGESIETKIVRTEVEEMVYEGPVYEAVDPYDFIIDLSCTDPQKALFIGDTRYYTLDELHDLQRLGIFENVDQLEEQTAKKDPEKNWRDSIRARADMDIGNENEAGAPRLFPVTEIHCRFDPTGRHETDRYIITVANDNIPLQIRRNPYDDKHYPYAVARVTREPFTFIGVSPMDHGIPIQLEMDAHRSYALISHRQNITPITWVPTSSDTPDSLLHVEPFSVFRSDTPPQFLRSPSVLGEMQAMDAVHRRDLAELIGTSPAPDFTGQGSTATWNVQNQQETNRRMRGYALAFASMLDQKNRIVHALNGQYMTRRQKFRVLGKAGVGLREYEEIGPEILNQEVDFEFLGIANLHTMGMRATGLQTALTIVYPYMEKYGDDIDALGMIDELLRELVGTRQGEGYVKSKRKLEEMMPQEDENILLAEGQRVEVHEMDNDVEHIAKMRPLLTSDVFEKWPSESQLNAITHMAQHVSNLKRKRIQEEAKAKMNPPEAEEEAGTDADRGTTGDRTPDLQAAGAGVAQTPPGEISGPPRSGGQSAPDRQARPFQTQNQGSK